MPPSVFRLIFILGTAQGVLENMCQALFRNEDVQKIKKKN